MNQWTKVSFARFTMFTAALAAFVIITILSEPGFIGILDHTNLLFHESGHMVLGMFSAQLEVYGGTLGQLTFPLILAVTFFSRKETISFSVGLIWFSENFFNIARYMADAREQQLELVGGGMHDWMCIFLRWHIINHDIIIARTTAFLGWAGIVSVWLFVAYRFWLSREEQHDKI